MNCVFCKNDNTNHTSEEHVCKKCNQKGLHSYKDCCTVISTYNNRQKRTFSFIRRRGGVKEVENSSLSQTTDTTRIQQQQQEQDHRPSFLSVASRSMIPNGAVADKKKSVATTTTSFPLSSSSSHFKYNNLFRVLVAMITKEDDSDCDSDDLVVSMNSVINFEHCGTKFTVDFTDIQQVDNFFDKMYTDSKTVTEEFVRAFMIRLSRFDKKLLTVDLHTLHIELFKNFYTVDPASLDDRYYVSVL